MKLRLFLLVFMFIALNAGAEDLRTQIRKAGNSSDYPGYGYIKVFDSTEVDVKETGLSYVTNRTLYKVLNSKGAVSLRSVVLDYDPLSAWIEFESIRIWKKNGEVIDCDISQTVDYPAPARMIYWGARQKMYQVGRMEDGDALEVTYKRKGFTYALLQDDDKYIPPMRGHFYDIVAFYDDIPVLSKYYSVKIPSAKNLKYEVFNSDKLRSVKKIDGDNDIFEFSLLNIMPLRREPGMLALSDVAPKVLMSTAKDWEQKSLWFYNVNEDYKSFESFPELDKLVADILKGAKTEYDSIAVLTHWVADNMRYCGVTMGEGEGYTLHNARMNYHDRCGVCKDKAGMLIAMLRSAGFESYPAMTMAGSRIEDIPADQFNHCVTLVKVKSGQYKLLDPTWVPFVRELWSSAEQQQNYLPGIPGGADLQITPVSDPKNHYVHIDVKSEINKAGTLKAVIKMEAEGQSDSGFRGAFVNSMKTDWEGIIQRLLHIEGVIVKIDSVDYGNPYDYSAPFGLYAEITIPDYAQLLDNGMIFKSFASQLFTSRFYHLRLSNAPEVRKYGFRDRCSRFIRLNEELTLPDVMDIKVSPDSKDVNGESGMFKGGYTLKDNILRLNYELSLNKRVYEAKDWDIYRKAAKAHNSFVNEPVILEYKKQ